MKLTKEFRGKVRLFCSECGSVVPTGSESKSVRFDWATSDPEKAVYAVCSERCEEAHWRQYNLRMKLWE